MKTIIAGSRTICDYQLVKRCIVDSGFNITEVVCGCAAGVDACGSWWALNTGVPVKEFPADWNSYGKSAGPRRNTQMANYADALICVHNGSAGSIHMVKTALAKGLKVYEKLIP